MTFSTVPTKKSITIRSPIEVCEFVDELPSNAAGEIVFAENGTMEGAVFIENGRLCWAAARGLAQRLTDLLSASANVGATEMESLYKLCQEQRTPLGDYLLKAGLISAEDLRFAMLTHTAESLYALCTRCSDADWLAHHGAGFNSKFSFATTEVLPRAFAEVDRGQAARAMIMLRDAFEEGDWGAAFMRSSARAVPDPIAIYGTAPAKIETLLRLGRWASSSLDTASLAHGESTLVTTVLDGASLVAWKDTPVIIAGWTASHGPGRLLNWRSRRRDSIIGDF